MTKASTRVVDVYACIGGAEMGVTALRNLLSSILRILPVVSCGLFIVLPTPSAVLLDEHEELFSYGFFLSSSFLARGHHRHVAEAISNCDIRRLRDKVSNR